MNLLKYLLVAVATASLVGCAGSVRDVKVTKGESVVQYADQVEIKYLGSGGHLIRRGNDVLMTAPFFSNPSMLEQLLPAKVKTDRIEAGLPDVSDVEMVLVGHSHYDHTMDLPYIAKKRAPKALFFGSATMKHLLAPAIERSRLIVMNDMATSGQVPGEWVYSKNRAFRFMALESDHAPHMLGMKLVSSAKLGEDLKTLPTFTRNYPEGEVFAYLIDFLNPDGKIAFRIYYQDTASSPGMGYIPDFDPVDQAPVDVAILCVGSFSQVKDYPEHILRMAKPKFVIAGHWEDFFRPQSDPIAVVPLASIDEFLRRARSVSQAGVKVPTPGTALTYRVTNPDITRATANTTTQQ
ncbi:MAG: hypothetical protein U1F63_02165 [Chitinivorax sp.]